MRFADVERLAVAYLAGAVPSARRVATDVPAQELSANLPMLRVSRGPGSDDGHTDSPLLDVEALAGSRGEALTVAEDARTAMHVLAARSVDGVLVDTVTTATGPTHLDYSPTVARFVASYRLALRATT